MALAADTGGRVQIRWSRLHLPWKTPLSGESSAMLYLKFCKKGSSIKFGYDYFCIPAIGVISYIVERRRKWFVFRQTFDVEMGPF